MNGRETSTTPRMCLRPVRLASFPSHASNVVQKWQQIMSHHLMCHAAGCRNPGDSTKEFWHIRRASVGTASQLAAVEGSAKRRSGRRPTAKQTSAVSADSKSRQRCATYSDLVEHLSGRECGKQTCQTLPNKGGHPATRRSTDASGPRPSRRSI